MSNDSYQANVEAIRSARELIDITRKELDILKSLVYEGSRPLNVVVASLEKDIEALQKSMDQIQQSLAENTADDNKTKTDTEKRVKALERVVWMGVGAAALLSILVTYFKGPALFG